MGIKHWARNQFSKQYVFQYLQNNLDPTVELSRNVNATVGDRILLIYSKKQIMVKIPFSPSEPPRIHHLSCLNSYGLQKVYESTGIDEQQLIKNGRHFFGSHIFRASRYKEATAIANLAAQRASIHDFKQWFMEIPKIGEPSART